MRVNQRRTRIVCTIGPSSESEERIEALMRKGMDIARLNFSHGSHADHLRVVKRLRSAAQRLNCHIPILMDLQGPKIRVGRMREGQQMIATGSQVTLTPEDVEGTATLIPVDYQFLAGDAREGNTILMDDGLLELQVINVSAGRVTAQVVVGGPLRSRKGVNLPDVKTSVSSMTAKDLDDLRFGVELAVDFVALSFVRHPRDVQMLRTRLRELGSQAAVIAKIEKPEALEEIDGIIAASDAIMVARGDLGIEIASERVPLLQKMIIDKCKRAGKPVITATQMLESMIEHPRPTRAESSDVANAVLDGTDAVMLSGESAVGQHPLEAVTVMDRICRNVELEDRIYYGLKYLRPDLSEKMTIEAISYSCVSMAHDVDARVIATITHSGSTAQRIAKYRPRVPIIAFTESDEVLRQLHLVWGVTPVKLEQLFDTDSSVRLMQDFLKDHGVVEAGDRVVIATGIPVSRRGQTNMVTITTIA